MQHETFEYIQTGVWNRQQELLKEASSLRFANRAVRGSRSTNPAQHGQQLALIPIAHAVERTWRAGIGRVGTVMVNAGHRLENLACRAANLS